MLFIPRGEEQLHKQIALVTAAGHVRLRHRATLVQFDYGKADKLQFFANVKWIDAIHSNYTIGARRHQPAAVTCCRASSPSW